MLATQVLASKTTHLGFGEFVTRRNHSRVCNQDYSNFEEFAYQDVAKGRKCWATDIFKVGVPSRRFPHPDLTRNLT